MNPFEKSGVVDHYPGHLSKAFEDLAESSCHTESLLASKSRLLSFSNASDKRAPISLCHKQGNSEEEKSLSVADLTSNDTFAISKSSKATIESKDLGEDCQEKSLKRSEGNLTEESKSSKPPKGMNWESTKSFASRGESKKEKLHCRTCKCLEISNSTIRPLAESESLRLLSGLQSLPKGPVRDHKWEGGIMTGRAAHKPYTSLLFNGSNPPSQIFRQRINSHILSSQLVRQISMPIFK